MESVLFIFFFWVYSGDWDSLLLFSVFVKIQPYTETPIQKLLYREHTVILIENM